MALVCVALARGGGRMGPVFSLWGASFAGNSYMVRELYIYMPTQPRPWLVWPVLGIANAAQVLLLILRITSVVSTG